MSDRTRDHADDVVAGAAPVTPPNAVPRVAFPPRWRTVLLAATPRDVCRQGMSLYSANRRGPLLAQHALWAASALFGARVIPGERTTWTPPMGDEAFAGLWSTWTAMVGRRIEGFAVYQRVQPERDGLALLLSAGDRSAFVRVHPEPAPFDLESRLSARASANGTTAFRVPEVIGSGSHGGWAWLAYPPLSTRPHVPARLRGAALTSVAAEIASIVEAELPRPAGCPERWRGAHGDLTVWNLRRAGSTIWLIDWEDAGYAPPGADRVYYEVTREALRRRPTRIEFAPELDEARRYWIDIVAARQPARAEVSLRSQMLVALGSNEGGLT